MAMLKARLRTLGGSEIEFQVEDDTREYPDTIAYQAAFGSNVRVFVRERSLKTSSMQAPLNLYVEKTRIIVGVDQVPVMPR